MLGAAALNTEHESHEALKKARSVRPSVRPACRCVSLLVAAPRPPNTWSSIPSNRTKEIILGVMYS